MGARQPLAGSPLRLPCGLALKNRLIKSAMSEKMAVNEEPTADHYRVYKRWANGGWAALVTGNIMVDDKFLGAPGDVAIVGTDSAVVERWSAWTRAVKDDGCHLIAQLNHPGRQSPLGAGRRGFFTKTLAPSAVPLVLGDSWIASLARIVLFGTPQAMTVDQIENVIAQFARAARLASQAGFHGVEIQAGHGFLLSQFLSSHSNKRSDAFGGSARKRTELVLRVIRAVRQEVPKSFCVGVKINTADDMRQGGLDDMLQHIALIKKEGIDYVQLSGGSFENPKMLSTSHSISQSKGTMARDGFFLEASLRVRAKFPDLVLFLTGGFRSGQGIESALKKGACDAVCLGRPAVKYPDLPNAILHNGHESPIEDAVFDVESAPSPGWIATKIRSVGAGAETKYYSSLLQKL